MNLDQCTEATRAVEEFGRIIQRVAAEAEAELEARGIPRRTDPLYGGPMPALDQLAEIEASRDRT